MDLVPVLLALVLGLLVGARIGASRALRLITAARRVRGAQSRIARFLPDTVPTRTAADILAGRVRVSLGGVIFDLPVLPRAQSRRWLETLDQRFQNLAVALDQAGDDTPQIMALLVSETDALYDVLLSYDRDHVLPSRDEADELATDAEILQAVLEVWRAANPLAVMAAPKEPPMDGTSPVLPSSPPKPTGGSPIGSSVKQPTSKSSPTSMPRPIALPTPPPAVSTRPSKPSGSGRSSRGTRKPGTDGAPGAGQSPARRAAEG